MCGISGTYHFDGLPAGRDELERMLTHVRSRGPDGEGYLLEGPLALGHRRLSIIELSDLGRQPMSDASGTVSITFNGEIYNYRELRSYLETVGMSFTTGSDTEVLLNGYRRWGMDGLLKRIDGMFAFVLFDRRLQLLFACRDRFGEKPLYYLLNEKRFRFSSAIHSITAVEKELHLDMEALDHYLSELCMPQPHSIWKEIRQLEPGTFLQIDIRRKKFTTTNYWRLAFTGDKKITAPEALEESERLLREAILSRTVADVPVACLLSSGTDSGLVVSLLAQQSSQAVNTFSVGFSGNDAQNEIPEARALAKKYGTNHTEVMIEPDAVAELPALISAFGEPFADSSALPSFYIYRAIQPRYKVALGGDGGDELFGGYHDYHTAFLAEEFAAEQATGLVGELKRAGNAIAFRAGLTDVNTGHLRHYLAMKPEQRLHREMGFAPGETRNIYNAERRDTCPDFTATYLSAAWKKNEQRTVTDSLLSASLHTRLLNDYLVKADRSSMALGLELRSPFLSPALAAFAAALPHDIRFKNGQRKYLLQQLAVKHIDPGFEKRPKRGFGIPLDLWLRRELKSFAHDLLFSGSLEKRRLFDMQKLRALFDAHCEGKADHRHKLWAFICLESWFKHTGA